MIWSVKSNRDNKRNSYEVSDIRYDIAVFLSSCLLLDKFFLQAYITVKINNSNEERL